MFLTQGPMPHEGSWRRWFQAAGGMLPASSIRQACPAASGPRILTAAAAACSKRRSRSGRSSSVATRTPPSSSADPIAEQHLFSVFLHTPPGWPVYPPGSLWHGHLIQERTKTSWGDITLVTAARLLLWEAFRDPLNSW